MSKLSPQQTEALRALPAVHEVLDDASLRSQLRDLITQPFSGQVLSDIIRDVLEEERRAIRDDQEPKTAACRRSAIIQQLESLTQPPLRSVINGTGIIIHTGLGRSPLAAAAVGAMADVAANYAPVELNMADGQRGQRLDVVRGLLCEITGAEAATVVNNNAASLMLILATLAKHRNVVVSRGELIEIGGSFRLPDIMQAAGCTLREVGTTNKTRLSDFRSAIDDRTTMILSVHPSNYRVHGFTNSPPIEALAELARERNVLCVHDVGSGVLQPWPLEMMRDEPDVQRSLNADCDLVLFSGDKALGGPQAGIIVGRSVVVEQLNKHPMMRAMRLDKVILAGLAATLQLHRDQTLAAQSLPVLQMLHTTVAELQERAVAIIAKVHEEQDDDEAVDLQHIETEAYLGGGSVPGQSMASIAIAISMTNLADHEIAHQLRTRQIGIVPRVSQGRVLIDLRTVLPSQDDAIVQRLARLGGILEKIVRAPSRSGSKGRVR